MQSHAGVYTVTDYLCVGNSFEYTLMLKTAGKSESESYTTISEVDHNKIIDRRQLIPDEGKLKSLTTKSSWSLDWFVKATVAQNNKRYWPSYPQKFPRGQLVELKKEFEKRYTLSF
jgi:hypothetical protein